MPYQTNSIDKDGLARTPDGKLYVTLGSGSTIASPTLTGTTTVTALQGGSILSNDPTLGIGYNAGAGGTVTQATSKSTGVTLNKVTGEITMNNASLAADTSVSFTLTNTAIAAADQVVVTHHSGGTAGAYVCGAIPAAGSAAVWVRNVTAGALAEAIVLKVNVYKSATS